jgi:hypothetical protein
MMTELQRLAIINNYEGFQENVRSYSAFGSDDYCHFNTYHDEESENIICGLVTISGISDNNQPFVKIENILIEPNGNQYLLEDLFPKSQVVGYLQKLKPFDWHG